MELGLVRPQFLKAGKSHIALVAPPLVGLGVLISFKRTAADVVHPSAMVVCDRVMVNLVLDAAHIRRLTAFDLT